MRGLVVDDEPSIRCSLRIALEAMVHDVREAATRAKALTRLHERPSDVVLLDLRLGGESPVPASAL